jgi:ferric-dicitrate binding protein FerR (iron transport regulator)
MFHLSLRHAWGKPLTKEELTSLLSWQAQSAHRQELIKQFADPAWLREKIKVAEGFPEDRFRSTLMEKIAAMKAAESRLPWSVPPAPEIQSPVVEMDIDQIRPGRYTWIWRGAVAAVIIICALVISRIHMSPDKPIDEGLLADRLHQKKWQDVPRNYGAVLNLGDGHYILLDTLKEGSVVSLAGLMLKKVGKNALQYTGKVENVKEALYHDLHIHQSEPMHLGLPDGSQVTLNSTSTLQYPVTSNMDVRDINLIGEATFYVAKDAKKPFVVHGPWKTKVRVLGTSFKMKAYEDEYAGEVILLSGRIEVSKDDRNPEILDSLHGRRVRISSDGMRLLPVDKGPPTMVLTWEEGAPNLYCKKADLKDAMHFIARWYDTKIDFRAISKELHVNGKFGLNSPLTKTLTRLGKTVDDKVELKQMSDSLIYIVPR